MRPQRLLPRFALAAACIIAALPLTAAAQGRTARDVPYSTSFSVTLSSGSGTNGFSPDAVPANKRLVVEFVSVYVQATPGEKPAVYLQDSVNGAARAYWVPLTLTETTPSGWEIYRSTQMVKLYVDGNGSNGPALQCSRGANSFSTQQCSVTLTGYLTDR